MVVFSMLKDAQEAQEEWWGIVLTEVGADGCPRFCEPEDELMAETANMKCMSQLIATCSCYGVHENAGVVDELFWCK